jgi:hypothetical protein
VLEVLGRPHRIVIRDDLRKPVETWFYGPADSYAIMLIDGRVFAVASTRIASWSDTGSSTRWSEASSIACFAPFGRAGRSSFGSGSARPAGQRVSVP